MTIQSQTLNVKRLDSKTYIQYLYEDGRRHGYYEVNANKNNILTLEEQLKITSILLEEIDDVEYENLIPVKYLSKVMTDNPLLSDVKEIIDTLKNEAMWYFYGRVEEMLKEVGEERRLNDEEDVLYNGNLAAKSSLKDEWYNAA
jgi:hypothetical protein